MNKRITYKSPEERERRLIYMREWCARNRERQNIKAREYQLLHPEVHRKASRKYASKHRKNKTEESLLKTETWCGRRAEIEALRFFPGAIDANKEIMNNRGYDIEWEGKRIDVKSSNGFRKNGKALQWTFVPSITGTNGCDYYFCMIMQSSNLVRAFLIPSDKFGKRGITIGSHSKKWQPYIFPVSRTHSVEIR